MTVPLQRFHQCNRCKLELYGGPGGAASASFGQWGSCEKGGSGARNRRRLSPHRPDCPRGLHGLPSQSALVFTERRWGHLCMRYARKQPGYCLRSLSRSICRSG